MINGRFVCYGSPGYLKSHYGQGYTVVLKNKPNQSCEHYVSQHLPFLTKVSHVYFDITYKVNADVNTPEVGGLGTLFKLLCEGKRGNHFADFSVTR